MPEQELSKKEKILKLIEEKQRSERIIVVDETRIQVVIFELSGSLYGFYGKYVETIVPPEAISPVPGTPDYVLGLTNVRGDIEAVVDLKMIMDLPPTPVDNRTRLIITQIEDLRTGFIVDQVEEVTGIAESRILSTESSQTMNKLVAAETQYKDKTVVLLDLRKIFQEYLNFES